ncbi:MAG: hypothetical protein KIT25_08280 [Enhydrobacter sp.]|nr:MAG: hypothetical protein KIT25_08280 [Enhydrobacter sp.]
MRLVRVATVASLVLIVAACDAPRPDYTSVPMAPAYRTDAYGRIDNENIRLDAEGYRIDRQGRRIGDVDIQAKMRGETSNAVAGYYITSIGTDAPGRVATPSEGSTSGAGYGPGSVNPMPSGTGGPVPLAPAVTQPSTTTTAPATR